MSLKMKHRKKKNANFNILDQNDDIQDLEVKFDEDGKKQGVGKWSIGGKFRYEGTFENDLFHGENCLFENLRKNFFQKRIPS